MFRLLLVDNGILPVWRKISYVVCGSKSYYLLGGQYREKNHLGSDRTSLLLVDKNYQSAKSPNWDHRERGLFTSYRFLPNLNSNPLFNIFFRQILGLRPSLFPPTTTSWWRGSARPQSPRRSNNNNSSSYNNNNNNIGRSTHSTTTTSTSTTSEASLRESKNLDNFMQ